MFPKPRISEQSNRNKTTIQARELFDLTDETNEGAKAQNLCDVINLDDTEYELPAPTTSGFTLEFTKQNLSIFNRCPFCETVVGSSRFSSHVEYCRGYQRKIEFNPALVGKFLSKSSRS